MDIKIDAREAMKRLAELGVGCRPFFYPIHRQPALTARGFFKNERYPVAERLYEKGFYLPGGIPLTDEQVEYAGNMLIKVLRESGD